MEVETYVEAITAKGESLSGLVHLDRSLISSSYLLYSRSLYVSTLHAQLFFHLYVALLSPRHVLALQELHLNEIFASGVKLTVIVVEYILLAFTRTENILCTHQRTIALNANTVLIE